MAGRDMVLAATSETVVHSRDGVSCIRPTGLPASSAGFGLGTRRTPPDAPLHVAWSDQTVTASSLDLFHKNLLPILDYFLRAAYAFRGPLVLAMLSYLNLQ